MTRNLILVRHGESVTNVLNIVSDDADKNPLTEKGMEQARRAAEELKKLKIDGIVSSPILRAKQTAEIISKLLRLEYSVDDRLREIGFGKFNGKSISEVPKFSYDSNEIEQWEKITERMLSAMRDHTGNMLFVSHGFPIRALAAHYLRLNENESYGISINFVTITAIVSGKKIVSIGSPKVTEQILEYFK